jgi:hypothetical protein
MTSQVQQHSCFEYRGSLEDLPPTATPGFLFLKVFIPKSNSLDPDDNVEHLVSPDCLLILNAQPPKRALQKTADDGIATQARKREKRNGAIERIEINFQAAWDIVHSDVKRVVIFESRPSFWFRGDASDQPVVMPEAGVMTLEKIPDSEEHEGKGVAGYWAAEIKGWHDRAGMLKKREEMGC